VASERRVCREYVLLTPEEHVDLLRYKRLLNHAVSFLAHYFGCPLSATHEAPSEKCLDCQEDSSENYHEDCWFDVFANREAKTQVKESEPRAHD
jgi:hypothetical protein